ncbi:UNVERIFIED_CONTAM: Lon protease-like protein [Murimonas intestini]|uniref:Lon protease-like protein n=1 Tax=Murimonas intestini TaxID=1337051 RepID=A0AB73SYK6_9FIRM
MTTIRLPHIDIDELKQRRKAFTKDEWLDILLRSIGMTEKVALPTLTALCSIALGKPVVSNLAILGDITISGTMIKVDELANTLQVCLDSGAKKVLIPSTSFVDFASVPADLMSTFQLIPYQSA